MRRFYLLPILVMFLLPGAILSAQQKFYQYYETGMMLMKEQKWARAVEEFRKASFIEEEDASRKRIYGTRFIQYFPNREIGIALFELGDTENALKYLSLSLDQSSSSRAEDFIAKAKKLAGNAERKVQQDQTPPSILISSPSLSSGSPFTTRNFSVSLKGSVNDESGISAFFVDGSPALLNTDKTFSIQKFLKPGENYFTFKAVDNHNNISEYSVTVVRKAEPVQQKGKAEPPSITLLKPAQQRGMKAVVKDKALEVKGIAESKTGIATVAVNNIEAEISGAGEFAATIRLNVGENLIRIRAVDKDNVASIDTFIVVRDQEDEVIAANPLRKKRKGKDYALLFGTDSYSSWTPLLNPINDTRAIARELKESFGYEVEVVENATLDRMMNSLRKYRKMKFEKDDQLLIFFAGHGHYDKEFKMGYVVAYDSRLDDENKTSYLPHDVLRTMIDNIPCEHILLILDVCHGGTFDQQLASSRGAEELYADEEKMEFISRKMQYRTRKFITSGSENYVSDGLPGRHSPFARRILEAFRSGGGSTGFITLSVLFSYVERLKDRPHSGEFGTNEPGSDFLFIPR